MASPNARTAMLRQTRTYEILPLIYRDAWLAACEKQAEGHCDPPEDGEVWEEFPGEKLSTKIRDRMNSYGLIAGCEFVISKVCSGRSIEVTCKHFGFEKANKHNLKDEVVRKDPTTGEVLSDRKRDKDDHRTGCQVRYTVSYRLKKDSKIEKEWIGHWNHPHDQHSGHAFPTSPMAYLQLKRRLEEYQQLEALGRNLRYSKMPYSKAREYFLKQGIGTVISPKAYYNLGTKLVKDIKDEDTPGALLAAFEQAGWKYRLRKAGIHW